MTGQEIETSEIETGEIEAAAREDPDSPLLDHEWLRSAQIWLPSETKE